MILLLDNYDSFTYNIVQYLQQLGAQVVVIENDTATISEIDAMDPKALILGPGPGTPQDAGITLQCVHYFMHKLPILGVCLGHQAIAQAFGARIIKASEVMHGRTSKVFHDHLGVFEGLDTPTEFTRYHSLLIDKQTLPDNLKISAWTVNNSSLENSLPYEIMGIRHHTLPIEAVQFHPESILSHGGLKLFENFLVQHQLIRY